MRQPCGEGIKGKALSNIRGVDAMAEVGGSTIERQHTEEGTINTCQSQLINLSN